MSRIKARVKFFLAAYIEATDLFFFSPSFYSRFCYLNDWFSRSSSSMSPNICCSVALNGICFVTESLSSDDNPSVVS